MYYAQRLGISILYGGLYLASQHRSSSCYWRELFFAAVSARPPVRGGGQPGHEISLRRLQVCQGDRRGWKSRVAGHRVDNALREIVELSVGKFAETERYFSSHVLCSPYWLVFEEKGRGIK
jgi:hypothetical protein